MYVYICINSKRIYKYQLEQNFQICIIFLISKYEYVTCTKYSIKILRKFTVMNEEQQSCDKQLFTVYSVSLFSNIRVTPKFTQYAW